MSTICVYGFKLGPPCDAGFSTPGKPAPESAEVPDRRERADIPEIAEIPVFYFSISG